MFKFLFVLLLSAQLYADFSWEGENYHKNSTSQQMAALELLKSVKLTGKEVILDLGCGDGKITADLAKIIPDGFIHGIDLSPSMIGFAKKFEGHNLTFTVGDIQELTFESQFDLITSFTAMQWVKDQEKGFRCIYKALKPSGKLLITVPNGMTWQLSEAVREVISREEWKGYPFCDKQYFFLRENYAAIIRKAGLEIESFKIEKSFNSFPDAKTFTAFVKQWLPFVQDVPEEKRDEFMKQVTEVFLKLLPQDATGAVFFDKYVYNIVAYKPAV